MTQHTLLRFTSLIIITLAFTALAYAASSAADLRLGANWKRREHSSQLLDHAALP